jgi:hypothetical protein
MLRSVRQLYKQSCNSEAIERARALLLASPLVRRLLRDREAVADALGWCGWTLAAGALLYIAWEIGGFSVLVGQGPLLSPPALQAPMRAAATEPQAGGCTQASLNRSTGQTKAASCQAQRAQGVD